MGLLTDIYNTVAKFFRPQDGQFGEDPSKSVAQNRLKLVLMQDRTNLTPKVLEQMRGEMIDLLSKYLEMDKDLLELNFEQEGNQVALMLSIPVIRAKDEDEIEAATVESADDNEDSEDSEEFEEENSDDESDKEIDSEAAPKPRKRKSKKVTQPEELGCNEENSNDEGELEELNNHDESTEQEIVCESSEG